MSEPIDYEAHRARFRPVAGTAPSLDEWDAGDDDGDIPPRPWLFGNQFCRGFVSTLLAGGGVGKTAVRVAQLVGLAAGRSLTGEHVFCRSRVLIVSLEDDADELRRRVKAARLHHGVDQAELKGWLFLAALKSDFRLAEMRDGAAVVGELDAMLRESIARRHVDVISLDPFVKTHSLAENDNNAIDFVTRLLAKIAIDCKVAVDAPHHVNKVGGSPGDANQGRGASAFKDGARLVFTLQTMTTEEAEAFGIKETERRLYIRLDSGKVNITPPAGSASWFKLVSVKLGNGTDAYPNGDEVQTVEQWTPPTAWDGLSTTVIADILNEIDAGLPNGTLYSDSPRAIGRAAWSIITKHLPEKTEAQARQIIKTWVKNGVLVHETYTDPERCEPAKGLRANPAKRPG